MLEVHRLELDQGEIALTLLPRLAHLTRNGVASAQVEAPDLAAGDVDVVRPRQVAVLRRAQEPEAVRQALEYPFGEQQSALLRLRLQDLEGQLLPGHAGGADDLQLVGQLEKVGIAQVLQGLQVEGQIGALRRPGAAVSTTPCVTGSVDRHLSSSSPREAPGPRDLSVKG